MSDREHKADWIEIIESGAFKTQHVFHSAEGILGVLALRAGKSQGVFQGAGGEEYSLKKTSPWKSTYVWADGNGPIGNAAPRKALSRVFQIEFEDSHYSLQPGGSKFRSWQVKDAAERVLCQIQPRGGLKRGAKILIRDEITLGLLVFCYSLVNRRWQEESS